MDHLGEHTTTLEEARTATGDVLNALDAIQNSGVRANVSVKLTQFGLVVDPKLCADNLAAIVERAASYNNFIRVDMEDSPVTQITLDIMREMRQRGFNNVGIVIQAYLYRSEADIRQLIQDCYTVRLCKGAYKEPARVAFPQKKDVDTNYDKLAALLIDGAKEKGCPAVTDDGRYPPVPGLATHDARRVEFAKEYARKVDLPQQAIEFQMLYGIRRELQDQLASEGYPVRVYVPYGTEWYPYYMRRLAERPANVWFFVSNFFRR